ncbi:rhamnosyltransferase [Arcanobacterium pluranimalium]|uniref:glycosyltransferase family 2 protein n=1 Tax=Arcanobacterium pluranimalium TaxID=108028 RepID=UPI00195E2A03|nr:glycosyltransferase family 2 protein [Arcanobacterium pluranimalium]MBM7824881.1 rhamnosyltransferase [Arcanobacterium pluranimalium]
MTTTNSHPHIWAVVITYHPDSLTHKLIGTLSKQVDACVVVDNGSTAQECADLRLATENCGAQLVELHENFGIAYAQNIGIQIALEAGATHVLLSDQDSLPESDMVVKLCEAMDETGAIAVGPYIRDENDGGDELVYMDRKWGPRRATKAELKERYVEPAFLLASGCLIDARCFEAVGTMKSEYFIDHVDLEWCLRARATGGKLAVTTATTLAHSLGDRTATVPFRAQPVHVHSPIRNYYLTRNTILLCKSGLLNKHWIAGYLLWLIKYVGFNLVCAPQRRKRAVFIARGLIHGILNRTGKY